MWTCSCSVYAKYVSSLDKIAIFQDFETKLELFTIRHSYCLIHCNSQSFQYQTSLNFQTGINWYSKYLIKNPVGRDVRFLFQSKKNTESPDQVGSTKFNPIIIP